MGRRGQGRGNAQLKPQPPAGTSHWAEDVVALALAAQGWRVLARNYRLRGGELDLVCEDEAGVIVVVEVKQRRSDAFGGAALAIDGHKRSRLRRTAQHYLSFGLRRPEAAVRFDAVLVTGDQGRHRLEHLRDVA